MKTEFVIVMGVSGSGKSAVGKRLAEKLGWQYFDADDYHSLENIAKMAKGIPLDDCDRSEWLIFLNELILDCKKKGIQGVLACSALKENYRTILTRGCTDFQFVFLKGSYELILSRLTQRRGHYMKPQMLQSQFATLEEPEDSIVIDISNNIETIINELTKALKFPDPKHQ